MKFLLSQYIDPVLVELEEAGYTASESDPYVNICAIITNNNSEHCAVEYGFQVILKVNATAEGKRCVICECDLSNCACVSSLVLAMN